MAKRKHRDLDDALEAARGCLLIGRYATTPPCLAVDHLLTATDTDFDVIVGLIWGVQHYAPPIAAVLDELEALYRLDSQPYTYGLLSQDTAHGFSLDLAGHTWQALGFIRTEDTVGGQPATPQEKLEDYFRLLARSEDVGYLTLPPFPTLPDGEAGLTEDEKSTAIRRFLLAVQDYVKANRETLVARLQELTEDPDRWLGLLDRLDVQIDKEHDQAVSARGTRRRTKPDYSGCRLTWDDDGVPSFGSVALKAPPTAIWVLQILSRKHRVHRKELCREIWPGEPWRDPAVRELLQNRIQKAVSELRAAAAKSWEWDSKALPDLDNDECYSLNLHPDMIDPCPR